MTEQQLKSIMRSHLSTVDAITDLLTKRRVSARDGEAILLMLAGISIGHRAGSLLDIDNVQPLAMGWKVGAVDGQ